jgi:hypothetical protein
MSEFFEAPPPREPEPEPEEREMPAWMGPPSGVLPCAIPIVEVLARNEEVAIGISGAFAYPTGFEMEILVLSAQRRGGRIHPFDGPWHSEESASEGMPEGLLRLGLEYGDGRKSMNTNARWFESEEASDGERQPTMVSKGGGGGERDWRQSFWFWPLPSHGTLNLVCEWPALEIPLTRHPLDVEQIRSAAASSKELFPSSGSSAREGHARQSAVYRDITES